MINDFTKASAFVDYKANSHFMQLNACWVGALEDETNTQQIYVFLNFKKVLVTTEKKKAYQKVLELIESFPPNVQKEFRLEIEMLRKSLNIRM